jgi:hypothetical protein
VFPAAFSENIHRNLGSEKLVDFLEALSRDQSNSPTYRLLLLFVLLELNPAKGFNGLRAFSEGGSVEVWMLTAITQRLAAYHRTRLLSADLRRQFIELIVDLQIKLAGAAGDKINRGKAIAELERKTISEDSR